MGKSLLDIETVGTRQPTPTDQKSTPKLI